MDVARELPRPARPRPRGRGLCLGPGAVGATGKARRVVAARGATKVPSALCWHCWSALSSAGKRQPRRSTSVSGCASRAWAVYQDLVTCTVLNLYDYVWSVEGFHSDFSTVTCATCALWQYVARTDHSSRTKKHRARESEEERSRRPFTFSFVTYALRYPGAYSTL